MPTAHWAASILSIPLSKTDVAKCVQAAAWQIHCLPCAAVRIESVVADPTALNAFWLWVLVCIVIYDNGQLLPFLAAIVVYFQS